VSAQRNTQLVALVFALAGCGATSEVEARRDEVVGGVSESRYPAVGFLLEGPDRDHLWGPVCGGTLIAPNVVITAAHCVKEGGPARGFSLNGEVHVARAVIANREYVRFVGHDLAALVLEAPITGVTPAVVADFAENDAGFRYVGYGRTTPGGYDVMTGYSGARKSGPMSVSIIDDYRLLTTSSSAGLCWGDSGGPLVDENDGPRVYGVLADFDDVFVCKVGNAMAFTRIAADRRFLEAVVPCATHLNPAVCVDDFQRGLAGPDGGVCDRYCGECPSAPSCFGCMEAGQACPIELPQVEQQFLGAEQGCSVGVSVLPLLAVLLARRRMVVPLSLLALLCACGNKASTCPDVDALVQRYNDDVRELPRACTSDAECALIQPSLPCAEMCSVAVSTSAGDAYRQKRQEYGAQCPACKASYDCVQVPEVARCRNGFCRGELADGG
jgi:hypothetical protein